MARPEGHKDPAYLVRTIVDEGVTTMHFVPSMLQAFLEEPGLERCVSLRRVICSGEALPRGALRALLRAAGLRAAQPVRADRGGGGRDVLPLPAGRPSCERPDRAPGGEHADLRARPGSRAGAGRGGGGAAPRRRPGRAGVPGASGADGGAVRPGSVWRRGRATVQDGRPGAAPARRERGVPRPSGPPGEDPGLPDRAGRDRGGASRGIRR